MKHQDHISRVAGLFGVAPSALRYWDERGLVRFDRAAENQYRIPTVQTMVDISDVILYRSCSLSVKDIQALPDLEPEEILRLLEHNEEKVSAQMAALAAARDKLGIKAGHIRELTDLRTKGLVPVRLRLRAMALFSYEDPDMLACYQRDSSLAGIYLQEGERGPDYTLWLTEPGARQTLRPADGSARLYLHGAFRVGSNRDCRHDLSLFRAEAERLGYSGGALLGRYLLTAREDGTRYDFYEGWLELEEG